MPEFFFDLFRARDRVGDFFPEQLAVALSHSLHGGLDGGFCHRELFAELRVGSAAWLVRHIILQPLK